MVKTIEIGNLQIGGRHKPVFIAEIGINHDGDLDTAMLIADHCMEVGADIIKTQLHYTDLEMLPSHPWHRLMNDCFLSKYSVMDLKGYVESAGKIFLCTPFCCEAVDALDIIGVSAFKTGSGECNNIPFLQHVASKGKPMIISTGMTTREELIASIDAVRKINTQIILMNCTSNYPSTPEQTRLHRIDWLRSTFNAPVGQSDHTPTISTALGAIARGAVAIEKHVTLDKNADGPDHKVSLLPSEFKQMVDMGMEIWEGLQHQATGMETLVEGEQELRDIANHSIVTLKPIQKGEEFTTDNIGIKRPGTGIPARQYEMFLGLMSRFDYVADEQLVTV